MVREVLVRKICLVALLFVVFSSGSYAFPFFTDTNNQSEFGIYSGGLVVGDIDKDGDLDKIITGWVPPY